MVAPKVEVFAEMELFHATDILLDSDGGGKPPGKQFRPAGFQYAGEDAGQFQDQSAAPKLRQ
jgi:hypothetical protein